VTRGRGEGSIFRRSDGRWAAQVDLGWEAGRRRRKTLYGKTRREVQERLKVALREQQLGVLVTSPQQSTAEFLGRWLEDSVRGSVRPATYDMYRHVTVKHLIPTLGRVPLDKLSPHHVQAMLKQKVGEGLSLRTVHHCRALLRIALNQALRWGLVGRNVAALVDSPRVERFSIKVLSPDEARALLAAAEGERLAALYSVGLALGLRQGEILGLRWEDVDLDGARVRVAHQLQRVGGKLRVTEPKTSRSRRVIAMPVTVVESLRRHRAVQVEDRLLAGSRWVETGFVFTTGIGTPIEAGNLRRSFWRVLDRAGLPRMRFHDLRHSCASLLLAEGVPARVVMETLGHSTITITQDTYSHVMPELQQQAAEAMDRVFLRRGGRWRE
jgi:integrase